MSVAAAFLHDYPSATDGEISVINHESLLDRNWRVFRRRPDQFGTAEAIVEEESRSVQFLGDTSAMDRLVALSLELIVSEPSAPTTYLIAAEVASIRHHFVEARRHVVEATSLGALENDLARLKLTLDQAMGENLAAVLEVRRANAEATGDIRDLVPLGALLADLGEFEEADRTYVHAIRGFRDLSPFPVAWTCFQLGKLWGEQIPEPDRSYAATWYQKAIEYLPAYTRARVHLAEIYLEQRELEHAQALLEPYHANGDPELKWRLAEVLAAQGRRTDAEQQLRSAHERFEALLEKHQLAFADHAAEFYLSAGNDAGRALDLARINMANRPTLRAFELALGAAVACRDEYFADDLSIRARARWGHTKAFVYSPLARRGFSRPCSEA